MSRLSVVLPAYNEELMIVKACRTLKKAPGSGEDSV